LITIENIHRGEHIVASERIRSLNVPIIQRITSILERGHRQGIFKADIEAVDLHMMISAFCFFRVSNRYTFGAIFRQDFSEEEMREKHKQMIGDAILSWLKGNEQAARAEAFHP